MRILAGGLCLCLACLTLQAASPKNRQPLPAGASLTAPQQTGVQVSLIDQPLHLSDFPNMAPRPDLRSKLAMVSDFIQNAPEDGKPATEKTEVWMAYTKSTIYFVFICYDRHPELIRGHLARRENILNDDGVAVLLDPFRDRRLGVLFRVNPAGVQADGAWSESSTPAATPITVTTPCGIPRAA